MLMPTIQSDQGSLCSLHSKSDQGEGGLDGHVVGVKRTADVKR